MISSQYDKYFTASNYDKLRKVYSVWICTNPPESKKNAIKKYSIAESNIVGNAPKEDDSNIIFRKKYKNGGEYLTITAENYIISIIGLNPSIEKGMNINEIYGS